MSKRTKKVGVTGKYGVRYGASLRKQARKILLLQHTAYNCPFCGKDATRWKAVGIWECKRCKRRVAGGAWSLGTSTGATIKSTIERLYKQNVEAQ
ncbi:ribosomal protein RPL37A [Babesia ovata]|uniref:Ribosomal protein RPL37A n=2 Tax=Babesia TaxID=5864 RepID=A0A2H6KA94_9APIC|nr:ribosomal protein L37a, putative [Babesia bigemina]XP_028866148.1 ribosomal protein RPL37A [Babesia ovata]GBE59905.1 ribosomal protein RPL37A [Babesia ovata]CDR96039.1 ribosomal protein L37a, putative [Babesia bigemina]|eukprot:XP_012768225.1 ribosomal protein L37a, putative [Babesia bigemina]